MAKELVISSNRHETKLAILEDNQLVEVFFQRANEYSLAGSIHKGRVTRVLPGMQSAFVNIGVERDAFLYVSDFFEENEEYDKIAAPPREKERRAPAAAGVEDPEAEANRGREMRDRKGKRSRRRKGRRDFPESKYAAEPSPGRIAKETVREESPPPPPEVEEPASPSFEDFVLLPGESLAKYVPKPIASPDDGANGAETAHRAAEAVDGQTQEQPETAAEPETEEPAPIAEAVVEPTDEAALEQVATDIAAEAASGEDEPHPYFTPEDGETQPQDQPNLEGEEPGASDSVQEPRPREIVAGLRDQGSRYPHRVSRKLRRRMRTMPAAEQETVVPTAVEESPRAPSEDAERAEKPAPSITDLLREGQEILVQISKEPLGQKGARITSHIALPGRYVVYMPTVEHLGVSRKIASDDERHRLKRILTAHRVGIPGGFIVRTAGTGKSESEIAADMVFLYNLWLDMRQKAERTPAPALIHHDLDLVQRVLRDQLTDDFKAVWVDNEETYERVLRFVERLQPRSINRIKLYTRPAPIFDAFNITSELEKALRPKVWLKSGGYIVVNQTEALVAIDINTGKFVGKSGRLEDTIVKTNVEAVKEVVRQIRLRDLGGIIVIDFIDMDERKNRQRVMQALEEEMRRDRAPYKILQFNDFGLVAITRKRAKQSLERALCAPCPTCEGAGYVKSVQTVIGEILQEAYKIAGVLEGPNVALRAHLDVAKELKSTGNDYLEEMEEILRRPVLVTADPELHPEKFDLA